MKRPTIIQIPSWDIDHAKTGASIRCYRTEMGVSQLQLARALGHQYGVSVCLAEAGKRPWTDKKFSQYVEAIDKAAKVSARKKISGQ